MARQWKCRGCTRSVPRVKPKCPDCGRKRPAPRRAAHRAILDTPYEEWVAIYGEVCGICGRPPGTRKLDRDHDHRTGKMRGVLCHRCNRALPMWKDVAWLEAAAAYLNRANRRS